MITKIIAPKYLLNADKNNSKIIKMIFAFAKKRQGIFYANNGNKKVRLCAELGYG